MMAKKKSWAYRKIFHIKELSTDLLKREACLNKPLNKEPAKIIKSKIITMRIAE